MSRVERRCNVKYASSRGAGGRRAWVGKNIKSHRPRFRGPYEVPLETWQTIVAGQRISVRGDGKFAQEKFDLKTAAQDAFVKRNQELDKKVAQE